MLNTSRHSGNNQYDDSLKLSEALQIYFNKYHFKNGGYDLKWFRIKLGPIFIPLPNTRARVEAVKIHDIHHVLTGYPATLKGEAEIGAWELASGCGKHYVAWILNWGSFSYGMIFFPKATFKAFLHGHGIRRNFYKGTVYNETLLERSVGELKAETGIQDRPASRFSGLFIFFTLCLGNILYLGIWGYIAFQLCMFII